MSVDLSELPREVIVKVGECQAILLPSYAGSGNNWTITALSDEKVARVWIEPLETPDVTEPAEKGTSEPPELMLVQDGLRVLGLTPGEATCQLTLARTFETRPTATHDFHITVR